MVKIKLNDVEYHLKTKGEDITLKEFIDFYHIIDVIPPKLKELYDAMLEDSAELPELSDRDWETSIIW